MDELVAGLIGVVVGGVVTGAVQVFQTWKDRQLKRTVAARLIGGDLVTARELVKLVLEKDRWPSSPLSFEAEYANWLTQREAFAAAVSVYDWTVVAAVYDHLATLATTADVKRELTDEDRSSMAKDVKRLDTAIEIAVARSASRWQRRQAVRRWRKSPLSASDT